MFDINAYMNDDSNLHSESLAKVKSANYFKNAWAGELPVRQMKTIRCAYGLEFSAQASEHQYCSPRQNLGPYTAVEVGFPSVKVEEFMPYIDGFSNNPTEAVYGWVPVEIVNMVVERHGGIVG